jgi:uncharacterized protein DUF4476
MPVTRGEPRKDAQRIDAPPPAEADRGVVGGPRKSVEGGGTFERVEGSGRTETQPALARPPALAKADLEALLADIDSVAQEDELALLRQAVMHNTFTCAQLAEVVRKVCLDNELAAVAIVAPALLDKDAHGNLVADATSEDAEKVHQLIEAGAERPILVPTIAVFDLRAQATKPMSQRTLGRLIDQLKSTDESEELDLIVQAAGRHHFTCAQVVKLLEHVAEDHELAALAFVAPRLVDRDDDARSVLKAVSIGQAAAAFEILYPESSEGKHLPMGPLEFARLLDDLRSESDDDEALARLAAAAGEHFFTCAQLAAILPVLDDDENEIKAIEIVAPKLIDKLRNRQLVLDAARSDEDAAGMALSLAAFHPDRPIPDEVLASKEYQAVERSNKRLLTIRTLSNWTLTAVGLADAGLYWGTQFNWKTGAAMGVLAALGFGLRSALYPIVARGLDRNSEKIAAMIERAENTPRARS